MISSWPKARTWWGDICKNTEGIQRCFHRYILFDGTFSFKDKQDSKLDHVPPRHVTYALQKQFKEELKWLQQQDIITDVEMDETAEWCNGFILVPKTNRQVRLCLDPARLNQTLIQPFHRCPTANDIFPKLTNTKYLTIIEESSGVIQP